jgi:hypothetical protein
MVGQAWPPNAAGTTSLRWRACLPVPQEREQSAQAEKADGTQSAGQGCGRQAARSTRAPHARPPSAAAETVRRARAAAPPPQLEEHWLHAAHWLWRQSAGHGLEPHCRAPARLGHTAPPCAPCVTTNRARPCEAPPQETAQASQAVHTDTSQ